MYINCTNTRRAFTVCIDNFALDNQTVVYIEQKQNTALNHVVCISSTKSFSDQSVGHFGEYIYILTSHQLFWMRMIDKCESCCVEL